MRQSLLVATAILVVFIVSVGANVVQVNAGRSHPLQTGGPGNCIEGQASVQEWCPGLEYRTWKRAMVCHGGHQVQETQDCPTETQTQTQSAECSAGGAPKDVTYCEKDPMQWETRIMCVDGAWKKVTSSLPCPSCVEGAIRVVNGKEAKLPCPNDPTAWSWRIVCAGGSWQEENQHCKGSECKPEGDLDCLSKCCADTFCLSMICETGWKCTNGNWENYHAPDGACHECFIATATFGSALSPEVQFLREFRDGYVMSTYSGRAFMIMFNSFYYSFSPRVASVVASNTVVKEFMQVLLRPLLTILELAYYASFPVYQVDAEAGVMLSGLIASSLLGLFYLSPIPALLAWRSRTFRRALASSRMMHMRMLLLCCLIGSVILATLIRSSALTSVATFATSVFLMILAALLPSRLWFNAPNEQA